MLKYILYRLLLIIPTLLAICIFSFFLFHSASTDPVHSLLTIRGIQDIDNKYVNYEKEYEKLAHEMHQDLPLFYISITPNYYPNEFYKITNKSHLYKYKSLLSTYKNWDVIKAYDGLLENIEKRKPYYLGQQLIDIENTIIQLIRNNEHNEKMVQLKILESQVKLSNDLKLIAEIKDVRQKLDYAKTNSHFFYPKFRVHGFSNQFHYWFINLFSTKTHVSLADGLPIRKKIQSGLKWSLSMSIISILLALIISIPIGFWSAAHQNNKIEKVLSVLLYFIYSIPLFWMATLLIVYFTSEYYAKWMNIFPSVGIFYSKDTSFLSQFLANSRLLILPIFCLTIHSLAYLIRQVRLSMISEMEKAYFISALSKGLTKRIAMLVHSLPNALIPLITIIIGSIPSAFAGSLVIEVLFNIPGMGRLMFQAVQLDDWTMISDLLILIALATVLFYLIGDILYTWLNPKIRFA